MESVGSSLLLQLLLLQLLVLQFLTSLASSCHALFFIGDGLIAKTAAYHIQHQSKNKLEYNHRCPKAKRRWNVRKNALSDKFLENDLIAVPYGPNNIPRLCVVSYDSKNVVPLCLHADDVETDLFVDPREYSNTQYWSTIEDHQLHNNGKIYGEGFYGQRPVPSLGGGPGYGAMADEIWSVSNDILELIQLDKIDIPILDVGIAHGEKARGGFI